MEGKASMKTPIKPAAVIGSVLLLVTSFAIGIPIFQKLLEAGLDNPPIDTLGQAGMAGMASAIVALLASVLWLTIGLRGGREISFTVGPIALLLASVWVVIELLGVRSRLDTIQEFEFSVLDEFAIAGLLDMVWQLFYGPQLVIGAVALPLIAVYWFITGYLASKPSAGARTESDAIDKIERLADLRSSGVLSGDEFESKKKALLEGL
jgi:hypothetical protein